MMINQSRLADANKALEADLKDDFEALGAQLSRRGLDIEHVLEKAVNFKVAVPSWGAGTGGTRFARFPGKSEPRNIFEKLEDCAVINQLVRITGEVSPHFPWDVVEDMSEVKAAADTHGLTLNGERPSGPKFSQSGSAMAVTLRDNLTLRANLNATLNRWKLFIKPSLMIGVCLSNTKCSSQVFTRRSFKIGAAIFWRPNISGRSAFHSLTLGITRRM